MRLKVVQAVGAAARSFAGPRCRTSTPANSEGGFSLVEVVIAILVLGILVTGFLAAMGTASKVLFITDEKETMKNLAESEMEYVHQQPYNYAGDYAEMPAVPQEYVAYEVTIPPAVTLSSENATVPMQEVTVIVSRENRQFTLVDYKVAR